MAEDRVLDPHVRALYQAKDILRAGPICNDCLGRAFARLGHGLTNAERGRSLRTVLSLGEVHSRKGTCWLCEDLFASVPDWAGRAAAVAQGLEYETYLFGVKLTPRLREAERLFGERFPTALSEPLKHAFNREVGKAFESRTGRGTLALEQPHLWFTVDLGEKAIGLRVLPLFVYGRYRKLLRGIPQTHWPCRHCAGKGCARCEGTGKQYPESVEELIAAPFLEAAQSREAHLHGAGREDIDARMLGSGRPFVLELVAPRKRRLDVAHLQEAVNRSAAGKVEVSSLRAVDLDVVGQIKEADAEKVYRALVELDADTTPSRLEEALVGLLGMIEQETPHRVLHRRADLLRERRVLEIQGELVSARRAEVRLRCDGGLYVKELMSGDEGRTRPSLSECLGFPARVIELDVMSVTSPSFPS